MNKFERWSLTRLLRKQVTQGYDHAENIAELYRMISVAAEHEFYEDNKATRDSFLTELFNLSLVE